MTQHQEPRRVHLVVNPAAGRGRSTRVAREVEAALARTGAACTVFISPDPRGMAGHVSSLAVDGAWTLGVVGGDGTVNEVVNARPPGGAPLCVFPAGTGNDFARLLGVRSPDDALAALAAGRRREFDLARVRTVDADGTARESLFINTMGIGFDAAVAARVARVRVLTGLPRYLAAVFSTLLRYRACEARVRADGEAWPVALFLASIGNGTTSGGGFVLTPDALPDDGMLDLCCVRDLPLRRILLVLPKTFSGGHTREPEVRLARAARFRLELAAPQAVHLDGEVLSERVTAIDVDVAAARQAVVVKV